MRQLWDLAEVAHERLASMTVEEKRTVLGLLDVRVHVQGYDPLRVHIEGFVKDGLSLDAAREPAQVGPQGLEPCPPDQKDSDPVRCAKWLIRRSTTSENRKVLGSVAVISSSTSQVPNQ